MNNYKFNIIVHSLFIIHQAYIYLQHSEFSHLVQEDRLWKNHGLRYQSGRQRICSYHN